MKSVSAQPPMVRPVQTTGTCVMTPQIMSKPLMQGPGQPLILSQLGMLPGQAMTADQHGIFMSQGLQVSD